MKKMKKECLLKNDAVTKSKRYVLRRAKATIDDLPVEILTCIFRCLPLSDRKAASLVSRKWNYAFHHPSLAKNMKICLTNGKHLKADSVIKSNVKCVNLLIKDSRKLDATAEFWKTHGNNVKKLTLFKCNTKGKTFTNILKSCKNLESLSVPHCKDFNLPGKTDLKERKIRLKLMNALKNLKKLDLSYHENLTNNFFVKLITLTHCLDTLLLTGSSIVDFDQIPAEGTRYKVSSNQVYYTNIIRYMNKKASNLKKVSFSRTKINYVGITQLLNVRCLTLSALLLKSCHSLTDECVQLICHYQRSLRQLDIGCCQHLTNISIQAISNSLVNLKFLSIQRIPSITDNGLKDLWKLERLETLNLNGCGMLFDTGIIGGLCVKVNRNMKDLRLSSLKFISENSVIKLMGFVPNLIRLDLSHSYSAVTDAVVQAVIANNKLLRSLSLAKCDKLTDAGLTGKGVLKPQKYPETRRGRPPKWMMVEIIKIVEENNKPNDTGISIKDLKGIKYLNLFGCTKITDDSVIKEFHFSDLTSLDLSKSQITQKGIKAISVNCKSLEKLTLYQCHQINDLAVKHIAKNCKRLREIYLSSKQLTQNSDNIISKKNFLTSKCLVTLDRYNP